MLYSEVFIARTRTGNANWFELWRVRECSSYGDFYKGLLTELVRVKENSSYGGSSYRDSVFISILFSKNCSTTKS